MATTTPANAGTISVPMSSVLDALKDKLSEAEQTTLFEQLIGFRAARVAPGDVITSTLFNQMLSDIDGLAIRVAKLEGIAGGPVIEMIEPATGVAVNGRLTVTGRNFNPEPRLNIVRIGDVEITQFRGDSTATQLLFNVPDLFAGLPRSLPLRVETAGRSSTAVPVTVKPEEKIQQGNFVIRTTASPPGAIAVGATLSFSWSIQAVTVLDDNVALSVLVAQPQGATETAWRANLAIQPGPKLPLAAGQTKTVTVSVKVPPGATSVQLALKAVSDDGRVTNASDPVTVTVGAAVEVSDPRIDLAFRVPALGGGGMQIGTVDTDGVALSGVLVKVAGNGRLIFTALDKRPVGTTPNADFKFTAQFDGPANGLVVGTPNPPTVAGIPAGEDGSFDLPLSAPAGAQINATARLKVSCSKTNAAGGLYTAFRIIALKIVS